LAQPPFEGRLLLDPVWSTIPTAGDHGRSRRADRDPACNRGHIYPFSARPATHARNLLSASPNINLDPRFLKMAPFGHRFEVLQSTQLPKSLLSTVFDSATQAQAGFGRPIATASARRIQFSLDCET